MNRFTCILIAAFAACGPQPGPAVPAKVVVTATSGTKKLAASRGETTTWKELIELRDKDGKAVTDRETKVSCNVYEAKDKKLAGVTCTTSPASFTGASAEVTYTLTVSSEAAAGDPAGYVEISRTVGDDDPVTGKLDLTINKPPRTPKWNGDWTLNIVVTSESSPGASTTFKFRTSVVLEAVETEAQVTFSTPYCELVATVEDDDTLKLSDGQACNVPMGTPLTLEIADQDGVYGAPMDITVGGCYLLGLSQGSTDSTATADAISFTASGTARSGNESCVANSDPLDMTMILEISR